MSEKNLELSMSADTLITGQQQRAIQLLLDGKPNVRVCEELSIVPSTLWRWRQNSEFAAAYREAKRTISERTSELLQLAATSAVARLVELMNSNEVPANIQYAAARSILDLHFKGAELEELRASVDELRQLLVGKLPVKKGLKVA